MHLLLVRLLIPLLWAGLAVASRMIVPPADVQVNLLFPRQNETYAPTQYLPIVFGIQNLDAVGPIRASLDVTVFQFHPDDLANPRTNLSSYDLVLSPDTLSLNQTHFHLPVTSMTNATIGRFRVNWQLRVTRRCWASKEDWEANDPVHEWSNSPGDLLVRGVNFFTEEGAQLPDIEGAINACDEPSLETDVGVRVTEVRYDGEADDTSFWGSTSGEEKCPVLDTTLEPSRCAYKPFAKELAANISEDILGRMGCEEGTWQTIPGRCSKGGAARLGAQWILTVALAAAIGCVVVL